MTTCIPTHFTNATRTNRLVCYVFGLVRFRELPLARAQAMWEKGMGYVRITAEGAKVLYADKTVQERVALLAKCRTVEEVEAILAVKPGAQIRKAADVRILELTPAPTGTGS